MAEASLKDGLRLRAPPLSPESCYTQKPPLENPNGRFVKF